MRGILVGWEFVLVLLGDFAEWFKGSRKAHNVAYLLGVLAFFAVLGIAGAIERMPL